MLAGFVVWPGEQDSAAAKEGFQIVRGLPEGLPNDISYGVFTSESMGMALLTSFSYLLLA